MTRATLNRKLRLVYVSILVVIGVTLIATFADLIPGLPRAVVAAAGKIYQFVSDMALLIATLAAAYLANVFQKRASFVAALEREWRSIVQTKSALFAYCEKPDSSTADYIAAFCRMSEAIDTMRVVYKNVGETQRLIGLYPYEPLHDMRRALQSIEPSELGQVNAKDRESAQEIILQAFYALRENFLEELDLEEPRYPIVVRDAQRLKTRGSARGVGKLVKRQLNAQNQQLNEVETQLR